VLKRGR
jgi:hypothetical protein